ncbi:MAG: hypothetical protein ACYCXG_09505 [Acidiferrobacter sp.]
MPSLHKNKPQVSAIERLRSLPDVFRGADLTVRFQWTSKTASQYLYLWKRRGLIAGAGGHSDVFMNLLTGRKDVMKALALAMPTAVITGIEALRAAGWTTQIPQCPTVAVLRGSRIFQMEGFLIEPRSDSWFARIRPGLSSPGLEYPAQLAPEWALADLLQRQGWGVCGLFPDDIEWEDVGADSCDRFQEACRRIGKGATQEARRVVGPETGRNP